MDEVKSRFEGQTILVTGATRGIGKAIVRHLLERGANVIGTGTRDSQKRMVAESDMRGVTWRDVDLSDLEEAREFCDWLRRLDRIDACINNAGVNRILPSDEVSEADYDFVHNVNLRSPYMICQALAGLMAKGGGGRILNIASIWSVVSKAHRSLYSTTKTGLLGMTRSLAIEWGPESVLINALSPGFVLTDLTRTSLSDEEIEKLSNQVPLRRMAEPSEIASVAAFLVSSENRYISGQNIVADGGFTIV